jgi:hypothetical protein
MRIVSNEPLGRSGWQQALFSPPIVITANTTYVDSYYAPNGGYAANANAFSTAGVDTPPLHALKGSPAGNGVFLHGNGGGFPINTFQATNYWVGVVLPRQPRRGPYLAPPEVHFQFH